MSALRRLGWRLEAGAYAAYLGLCRALGRDRASRWSGAFARAVGPRTRTDHVARVNLGVAFPDRAPEWRDETASEIWERIGRSFGEFAHLRDMPVYQQGSRIEVEGAEILDRVRDSGRGAVFISGHFANWEVMAMAIVQRGVDCAITYRAANNPWFDEQIKSIRRSYGVETLTPKAGPRGAKQLLEHLRAGRSVALMNDQKFNEGISAPFFGLPAMTAPGPTRMAMRAGVPLIPMAVQRLPDIRFRVKVFEPIAIPETGDRAADIQATVETINRFIEDRIRESPPDWFWVHRRFDKGVYRRG